MIREFEVSGFKSFVTEWAVADAYHGLDIEVSSPRYSQVGICAGVDESGRLLLDTAEGRKVLSGGEVMPSVRPVGPL